MSTKLLWGIGAGVIVALVIAVVATGGGSVSGEVVGQGNPVAGKVVFEGTCAACHGVEGVGTEAGPPLVHAYYRPGHHADGAFTLAIRNGVQPHHWNFGAMPPQPDLSDQDIADVTAYVRQIQEAAGVR
ncbi:MAG: c-type cytochrome [Acidimicrobiia bacterium]